MVTASEKITNMQSLVELVREFSKDKPHFIGFGTSDNPGVYNVFFYGSKEAADLAYALRTNSVVKYPYEVYVQDEKSIAEWDPVPGPPQKTISREEYERGLDYMVNAYRAGSDLMVQLLAFMPYMRMQVHVQEHDGKFFNRPWPSFSERLKNFYLDPFPEPVIGSPSRLNFYLQPFYSLHDSRLEAHPIEILTGGDTRFPSRFQDGNEPPHLEIIRGYEPESQLSITSRVTGSGKRLIPVQEVLGHIENILGNRDHPTCTSVSRETARYMGAIGELKSLLLLPGK